MRKQCLCAHEFGNLLDFEFYLSIRRVSMKHLLIVQLTIGNPIQFTELAIGWLTPKIRNIIEVMYRGT